MFCGFGLLDSVFFPMFFHSKTDAIVFAPLLKPFCLFLHCCFLHAHNALLLWLNKDERTIHTSEGSEKQVCNTKAI